MTFTKVDNSDLTLEENQDRITDNVWITRANTQGIFNIVTETGYTQELSPADTEWAFGTTADALILSYDPWEEAIGTPPEMMDLDMVVHLITDDIYIDIKFTSWTAGGNGGGFTYERSTNPDLSNPSNNFSSEIIIYPNPANEYLKVSNLLETKEYKIINVLGTIIYEGSIENDEKINILDLKSGIYFLKIENYLPKRFIKV
jgi:hypothetical protein